MRYGLSLPIGGVCGDARRLAEYAALAESARQRLSDGEPFDISVGGRERRADWEEERVTIAALGAAGVTWWIEWIAPQDEATMRAAITRGPLRV